MGFVKRYSYLLPIGGIVIYLLLYIYAADLYPGGSQADKNSIGYNWRHNYWCNLLSVNAINGQPNQARPVALVAMAILCISLIYFWWRFFGLSRFSKRMKLFFRAAAILSMLFSFFIFTNWHDRVIDIASLFGIFILGGMYYVLFNNRQYLVFYFGMGGLVLIILNNFLYRTGHFYWLPLVQLTTFIFFLFWICLVCVRILNNRSDFRV